MLQLTHGVRHHEVNFCVDTGSATIFGRARSAIERTRQGLPLGCYRQSNTGPTTIQVNGLPPRVVAPWRCFAAQRSPANMIALLVDGGSKFQMVNFQGVSSSVVNNFDVDIQYAQDTGPINHVIAHYPIAITSAQSGDLVLVRIANVNSVNVDFKVDSLAPAPLTRNDGLPLQQWDLIKDEILLLVFNQDHWQVMRLVRSQVFFKITQNLILYVRTDGDDVNGDGSANTPTKAFKTVQRAVDYVKASFLIGGRTVTIQLGIPGTYVGQVGVANIPGRLVIRGDPSNPNGAPTSMASYVIQGPPGKCMSRSVAPDGHRPDFAGITS
jgi:hypothetical protein